MSIDWSVAVAAAVSPSAPISRTVLYWHMGFAKLQNRPLLRIIHGPPITNVYVAVPVCLYAASLAQPFDRFESPCAHPNDRKRRHPPASTRPHLLSCRRRHTPRHHRRCFPLSYNISLDSPWAGGRAALVDCTNRRGDDAANWGPTNGYGGRDQMTTKKPLQNTVTAHYRESHTLEAADGEVQHRELL